VSVGIFKACSKNTSILPKPYIRGGAHRVKIGGRPTLKESEVRLQRVLDVARRNFLTAGYPDAVRP
jgi:hypothetical protein